MMYLIFIVISVIFTISHGIFIQKNARKLLRRESRRPIQLGLYSILNLLSIYCLSHTFAVSTTGEIETLSEISLGSKFVSALASDSDLSVAMDQVLKIFVLFLLESFEYPIA